jgi:hypothetical protein
MTPLTLPPALWTADQVAAYLCLRTRRVMQLAREGVLPCVRLPDGDVMFDPASLAEWIDSRRVPARAGGDNGR